jgi:hypothetical protein
LSIITEQPILNLGNMPVEELNDPGTAALLGVVAAASVTLAELRQYGLPAQPMA